jgi:hypothetical protein
MFKPMGALCENFSLVMTNNKDVSCCICGFDMYLVHRNHANYVHFLEWSWSIQAVVSRSHLNSHLMAEPSEDGVFAELSLGHLANKLPAESIAHKCIHPPPDE